MGNCFNVPVAATGTFDKSSQSTFNKSAQNTVESVQNTVVECPYKNSTNENTPFYTFENIKKKIKILNIVDGDTVDIAFHHEEMNRIFKYRVRLYGIDTPEKRPLKSNPNREKEIAASKVSKNALTVRLQENDNILVALFYKADKYGRLLATLYDKNGDNINEWMITAGYAYAYFGKTKEAYE